jgi:hypothetical protein
MGFGGMLAGGCDVGVGLSGAAVFTLIAMWASAALTDRLLDPQAASPLDQSRPSASVGAR